VSALSGPQICKHIWAALLAAEAKGHLKQMADMDQPFIETEIEYESGDGADEPDDFDEDFGVYPVCSSCGRRHPRSPPNRRGRSISGKNILQICGLPRPFNPLAAATENGASFT
jgi:hypothetical protein